MDSRNDPRTLPGPRNPTTTESDSRGDVSQRRRGEAEGSSGTRRRASGGRWVEGCAHACGLRRQKRNRRSLDPLQHRNVASIAILVIPPRGAEHRQKVAHGVSRGTLWEGEQAPDGAAEQVGSVIGWELGNRSRGGAETRRGTGSPSGAGKKDRRRKPTLVLKSGNWLPGPGSSPFAKPPDVVFYGWRVAADVRTLGRWAQASLLTSAET